MCGCVWLRLVARFSFEKVNLFGFIYFLILNSEFIRLRSCQVCLLSVSFVQKSLDQLPFLL